MKESKAQIKARLTNEIHAKYIIKTKDLKEQLKASKEENCKLHSELCRLKDEFLELREKLERYESWVDRLTEFANIPEERRKEILEKMTNEVDIEQKMADLLKNSKMMQFLYGLY